MEADDDEEDFGIHFQNKNINQLNNKYPTQLI